MTNTINTDVNWTEEQNQELGLQEWTSEVVDWVKSLVEDSFEKRDYLIYDWKKLLFHKIHYRWDIVNLWWEDYDKIELIEDYSEIELIDDEEDYDEIELTDDESFYTDDHDEYCMMVNVKTKEALTIDGFHIYDILPWVSYIWWKTCLEVKIDYLWDTIYIDEETLKPIKIKGTDNILCQVEEEYGETSSWDSILSVYVSETPYEQNLRKTYINSVTLEEVDMSNTINTDVNWTEAQNKDSVEKKVLEKVREKTWIEFDGFLKEELDINGEKYKIFFEWKIPVRINMNTYEVLELQWIDNDTIVWEDFIEDHEIFNMGGVYVMKTYANKLKNKRFTDREDEYLFIDLSTMEEFKWKIKWTNEVIEKIIWYPREDVFKVETNEWEIVFVDIETLEEVDMSK